MWNLTALMVMVVVVVVIVIVIVVIVAFVALSGMVRAARGGGSPVDHRHQTGHAGIIAAPHRRHQPSPILLACQSREVGDRQPHEPGRVKIVATRRLFQP